MNISTFPKGPLGANLYVIEHNGRYLIVDPCVVPSRIDFEERLDKVEAVFITHGHFDHIISVDSWNSAPVYMHEDDFPSMTDPSFSLVSDFGLSNTFTAKPLDIMGVDEKIFLGDTDDGIKVNVIHTPGHCPGQVCIVMTEISTGKKVMFSGDMLFAGAVGRFDFRTSSSVDMGQSIQKLKELDISCDVYPGHGPSTTLDIEKRTNPYF